MEENCVGRKRWKMLVVCWARWDCKIIDICLHEVYGSHLSNVELIRHMRCAFCVLTEYLLFYELFTHRIQYARSTKKWGRQKDRILSHCTRVMNENIPFFFCIILELWVLRRMKARTKTDTESMKYINKSNQHCKEYSDRSPVIACIRKSDIAHCGHTNLIEKKPRLSFENGNGIFFSWALSRRGWWWCCCHFA